MCVCASNEKVFFFFFLVYGFIHDNKPGLNIKLVNILIKITLMGVIEASIHCSVSLPLIKTA